MKNNKVIRPVMINPKILILPDIHGRKFYCNALFEAGDKGENIVCLCDDLVLHTISSKRRSRQTCLQP